MKNLNIELDILFDMMDLAEAGLNHCPNMDGYNSDEYRTTDQYDESFETFKQIVKDYVSK